jgi:hypothetical protein
MLIRDSSPGRFVAFRWIGGVVMAALFAVAPALGFNEYRQTHLTFSRSVGLPGVTLPAGTYEFRLADPATNQSIVMVRETVSPHTLRYLGATVPVKRPANLPENVQVTLGGGAAEQGTANHRLVSTGRPDGAPVHL